MTDYPTRAEIDAADDTLERLQRHIDRSASHWGLAYSALDVAREVLGGFGPALGLSDPDPEPEPKPTAAEVLREACHATDHGTPERGITLAAMHYAEAHPEWFADWHEYKGANISLAAAAQGAASAEEFAAFDLLNAAAEVAKANPRLFGGAA